MANPSPTLQPPAAISLPITGMTCASCALRIERALRGLEGVIEASVNLALERTTVRALADSVDHQNPIAAIEQAGHGARPWRDDAAEAAADEGRAERRDLWLLMIAACLTVPLVAQMLGMLTGWFGPMPAWLEMALATPVQFMIGRRFYLAGLKALRAGSGNMDLLVAMGTSAAFFYSTYLVLTLGHAASGHLYFEASAVIITLVLAGKVLEARARRSASVAIRHLMALRPRTARLLRAGQEVELPIGNIAIVRPGEQLPMDGEVVKGTSELDEALVTGESMAVTRSIGDAVIAGSLNGPGLLHIRAARIGADTTLARIATLVDRAQSGKAPIQGLVDRISAVFVPTVPAIAAVTFLVWLAAGCGFEQALTAAVAILVIACPCALGLATPTALVAGTGAAARAGILIRDIETLERAHVVTTVAFDKTGTLTAGRPAVQAVRAFEGTEDDMLRLAASAEQGSEHPLGQAMVRAARSRELPLIAPDESEAVIGMGLVARRGDAEIVIGRPELLIERGIDIASGEAAAELSAGGGTVVWIARDGRLIGLAESLGVNQAEGDLQPGDKAARIERLAAEGQVVLMIGDGINDTAAPAAADVSMAMSTGADAALEAAGITSMRADLMLVPAALDISRATWRKIRQNLFWAFAYNVVGIPLAALGYLSPTLAGAAMAMSSVSVVTNSLLLTRWRATESRSSLGRGNGKQGGYKRGCGNQGQGRAGVATASVERG